MSRRQKIVIIAVFVLMALLYTGAAATGGSGEGDASKKPGGIVGWLGDLVGQPPAADRKDLTADCLVDKTLTVKGTCVLHVAKSSKGTRKVALKATDAVKVTSRAPQGHDEVTADVDAGKDVSVTVDGDAADITIACSGADQCTVTLG